MPYNTRRKSLSLPSLGIQLPHSSRSLHQQTSPALAHPHPHPHSHHHSPPHKKVKRDHSPTIRLAHSSSNKPGRYDPTPPPSPPPPESQSGRIKIDYAELNDEIVAGVVGILEETGNRPHTVKELALSLAPTVNLVEKYTSPVFFSFFSPRTEGCHFMASPLFFLFLFFLFFFFPFLSLSFLFPRLCSVLTHEFLRRPKARQIPTPSSPLASTPI